MVLVLVGIVAASTRVIVALTRGGVSSTHD
jgi:hypothetical protein